MQHQLRPTSDRAQTYLRLRVEYLGTEADAGVRQLFGSLSRTERTGVPSSQPIAERCDKAGRRGFVVRDRPALKTRSGVRYLTGLLKALQHRQPDFDKAMAVVYAMREADLHALVAMSEDVITGGILHDVRFRVELEGSQRHTVHLDDRDQSGILMGDLSAGPTHVTMGKLGQGDTFLQIVVGNGFVVSDLAVAMRIGSAVGCRVNLRLLRGLSERHLASISSSGSSRRCQPHLLDWCISPPLAG